jgi:hypothetical protein
MLTRPLFSGIYHLLSGQIAKKSGKIISVTGLLFCGTLICLFSQAIAPRVAQADTAHVDLMLDHLPDESYNNILHRALAVARNSAQRHFDRDILITEVSVIVSTENQGAIAPILRLQVSRDQWQQLPDPKYWTTYFATAKSLLFWETDAIPNTISQDTKAAKPNPANNSAPPISPPAPEVSPNNDQPGAQLPVIPPDQNP